MKEGVNRTKANKGAKMQRRSVLIQNINQPAGMTGGSGVRRTSGSGRRRRRHGKAASETKKREEGVGNNAYAKASAAASTKVTS